MENTQKSATGAFAGAGDTRVYDFDALKANLPIKDVPKNVYKIDESKLPEVLDQGPIYSCVACALTVILEYFNTVETGDSTELSHPYIYGRHRDKDSNDWGMFVEPALKTLLDIGTVPMSVYSQALEMPEAKKAVYDRKDLEKLAKGTRIKSFCRIRWINTDELIKNVKLAIANVNAPLIAISNAAFGEPHAVVIYGVNESAGVFYIQNSWGTSWGDDGRSTIPVDDIDYLWMLMDEQVSLPFKDVPEDAWYYKAVLHMYSAGYINGKSATLFCPEDYIKRSEVAAILDRVLRNIDEINQATYKTFEDRMQKIYERLEM